MKLKLTHPTSAFLKQAHSRAKIISKVIHQTNPDSLTQTTMSACTDGAIHCSEGYTDIICQDQEDELADSSKLVEKNSQNLMKTELNITL